MSKQQADAVPVRYCRSRVATGEAGWATLSEDKSTNTAAFRVKTKLAVGRPAFCTAGDLVAATFDVPFLFTDARILEATGPSRRDIVWTNHAHTGDE